MCITWLVFQMTGETSGFLLQSLQVCGKTALLLALHFFLHSLVLFFLTFRFNRASCTDYSCRALGLVPPPIPVIPKNCQSRDGNQKKAGISQDAQRSYPSSFPAFYYNATPSFATFWQLHSVFFVVGMAHNCTFQHILEQSAKRGVYLLPRLG